MTAELGPGDDRIAMHVYDALGVPPRMLDERIGGSVAVLEKRPADGPITLLTAGVSRMVVDHGPPVELAVEVLEGQQGAGLHALRIVCDDIATRHRVPPIDVPWRNEEPVLLGTQIFAVVATGSRHGASFDEVRDGHGQVIGRIVTLRLLTYAESWVADWATLVARAGGVDRLLDVTRADAALPDPTEIGDRPVILSKLHAQHPPRWITCESDGMFSSVTGLESDDYMADSDNHEVWSVGSFAARFPWVTGFLRSAVPDTTALFEDDRGGYQLED